MGFRSVARVLLGAVLAIGSAAAWGVAGQPEGSAAAERPAASPLASAQPISSAHAQGSHGDSVHGAHASDSAHGAHGSGQIDPLGLGTPEKWKAQQDLALWTGAVFLVFFLVLWRFAWRPIAQGLDQRERQIADQIQQTQANHEQARQLLAEYQRKLAASEAEVRAILERGRQEAEQLRQQILQQAKAETEAEKQRLLREIDAAAATAAQQLAEKSARLAVDLAGKLVRAELDVKAHARLVEQAVRDFSALAPGEN